MKSLKASGLRSSVTIAGPEVMSPQMQVLWPVRALDINMTQSKSQRVSERLRPGKRQRRSSITCNWCRIRRQDFSCDSHTACNLLDTIHPLWLCLKQTDFMRAQAEAIAQTLILRAPERWQTGTGFAFADGQQASLHGTEMWLSTLHLAADLLGVKEQFAFVPQGVHRTRAAGLGL